MRTPTDAQVRSRAESLLRDAESNAWLNLSRGKYSNFGYWAAKVVQLRALLGRTREPSPFRTLRELALARSVALPDADPDVPAEEAQ